MLIVSDLWFAHHDSLKLCSDRDLPIWLLRKRKELKGEDVGDRVLEQATDALGDSDEHGNGDDLGLENLFAEMTEEGLEQRSQTQDRPYGDEAGPDVLNDNDPELFEDYIEINDAQRKIPGHEEAVLSNDLRTWMIMGYKYISLNLN